MKKHILILISATLMLSGCSAPAEQIVTIVADNTPMPAVTPVITPTPTEAPTAEPVPTAAAAPTPKATAKPTEAPAATPTVQPTISPTPSPTVQPTAEPTPEPTPAPTAEPAKTDNASDLGSEILKLVNSHRSSAGLGSLTYSSAMQKAANTRAQECVSSFSHTRPDGSNAYTALTERGVSFTAFGENLFAASGMDSVSAKFVVEKWMESSAHRQNIMQEMFTHMCIGVASVGDKIFVVQLFGAGIS